MKIKKGDVSFGSGAKAGVLSGNQIRHDCPLPLTGIYSETVSE